MLVQKDDGQGTPNDLDSCWSKNVMDRGEPNDLSDVQMISLKLQHYDK